MGVAVISYFPLDRLRVTCASLPPRGAGEPRLTAGTKATGNNHKRRHGGPKKEGETKKCLVASGHYTEKGSGRGRCEVPWGEEEISEPNGCRERDRNEQTGPMGAVQRGDKTLGNGGG